METREWNIRLTEDEIKFLVELLQNVKLWHLQGKIPPLSFEDVDRWNHIMATIDTLNIPPVK